MYIYIFTFVLIFQTNKSRRCQLARCGPPVFRMKST